MTSPPTSVHATLKRLSRAWNRRRVGEELVRALAWLAIAAVVAIGIGRIPLGLLALGIERPGWMPTDATLRTAGWALLGVATLVTLARATVRTLRRRIDVGSLARHLDREHGTQDVISTALALEGKAMEASPDLAAMIGSRASTTLGTLGFAVRPFAAPSRSLATVGVIAAVVALLPASADSIVDLAVPSANAAAAATEPTDPPLSDEALQRLTEDAQALADLEKRPALRDSTRERLEAARRQLEALQDDPSRSLGKLSRAERALEQVERQSREEGLHDPEKLREMARDELAEQLAKAMENGHDETAAAMAEEMARRLEDADEHELREMARALEDALAQNPPSGSSSSGSTSSSGSDGSSSDASATPSPSGSESGGEAGDAQSGEPSSGRGSLRESAEGLPERMRSGDAASARRRLREMAEQMGRGSSSENARSSLDRTLEDIRRARSEQLAEMNGEGKGQGQGEGQGQGQGEGQDGEGQGQGQGEGQGEGQGGVPGEMPGEGNGKPGGTGLPFGLPGGKPGPGGGDGSDALGDPKEVPLASLHGADKVEATPDGPAQGSIRVIRSFTQGHRDSTAYRDLHRKYASIAESATRREQIPLTRRDYIREYFQAVRPQ